VLLELFVALASADEQVQTSTLSLEKLDRVVVTGQRTKRSKLETTYPATSLELRSLDARATDTADVLERVRGINVRSRGGVGARQQVSIDGLSGRRVRTFVDGVPSEVAGFDFAPVVLPISLLERVDVYRGVVPVRFGTDALGGGIDFVSRARDERFAEVGYRLGSFNSHQGTAAVGSPLGFGDLRLAIDGFVDGSANSYEITFVEGDASGNETEVTVPQFNDGFLGYGAAATLFHEPSSSTSVSFRGFATGFDDDVQHGVTLESTVAGEASSGQETFGGLIRARFDDVTDWLSIDGWAAASQRSARFRDVSRNVYGSSGAVVRVNRTPGELTDGLDTEIRDLQFEGRTNFVAEAGAQAFTLSLAPKWLERRGQFVLDENDGANLVELISGVEWRSEWLEERLTSLLFGKLYFQAVQATNAIFDIEMAPIDESRLEPGAGAVLELRLLEPLKTSLSYEWAIRLPDTDELLGDGRLIASNPELRPERSHNGNLILRLQPVELTPWLDVDADVGSFVRSVDDQIFSETDGLLAQNKNVDGALLYGTSGNVHAELLERHLELLASLSWERAINQSEEGEFARRRGDQLPNRPVLFATFVATGRVFDLFGGQDILEVYWRARWVDDYFLFWESDGEAESKVVIPAQLSQDAGVTYDALSFARSPIRVAFNLEIRNIGDEDIFDFFRVPQPGRSVFFKASAFY
jgi:vitamin B12 transporter